MKQLTLHEDSRQRRLVRRFAAKSAPTGQRQIRAISAKRVRGRTLGLLPPCASLRQRLRLKAASGGLWSARPMALTSLALITRFGSFRRPGFGVVGLRR